jgi:CheY-like chemotaxis protein
MHAMQASTTSVLAPAAGRSNGETVVLIVDDYQDCREMYAAYLSFAGFRILEAANGRDALAIARRALPDLVLMDLGLPGLDGCETTRLLKEDAVTRHVPVVAFTAQCLLDEDALRETGFEGLITKPCRPDELAERVARVVRQPESSAE